MKLRNIAIVLLASLSFAACAGATQLPATATTTAKAGLVPLQPTDIQSEAAQLSARFLTRYHYDAKPLNDAMSQQVFKAYLDALDGGKVFFTQKDIDGFAALRSQLDDAIWNRDLSGPFAIFNLYLKRAAGRYAYARSLLPKGFTFSGDETLNVDREHAPWEPDMQALDQLWQKRVKNDWLRLKLAGKKPDAIRKLLDQRYADYIDRISKLDGEDAFQSFMDTVARTTDPHTDYFGPRRAENFAITMRLSLEGIGAVLQADNEYTQVRSLVPGGPASNSEQIHVGDRIVGVGQGKHGNIQNIIGWRLDDVVDKIRGKKGSVVRLEIIPAKAGLDGKHQLITLTRAKVTLKQQAAKSSVIEVKDHGTKHLIGVIDLPTFYEDFAARAAGDPNYKSASRDVAKLIEKFKKQGVDGIIVDLRNNGGGSLSEAINLTGLFINQGPVVQVRNSVGRIEVNSDTDAGMAWAGPLAVLVNRGTASASEIFASAIKDYGRGLIIGEPTFGKGTVQNLVNLDQFGRNPGKKPTYGELKMTIAKFFRINGGSTQLRGVTPDIDYPKNGNAKDFGESTYPNALPWTHIAPADYQPVAELAALVPMLEKKHQTRVATSPAWQLLLDELAVYRDNRERTVVSLNYAKREARRKHFEELQKQFNARRDAIHGNDGNNVTKVHLDDGLQPDERSLKEQLKQEKQAKNSDDTLLIETAHILADELNLIHGNAQLAREVLPYNGKYTPGFGQPPRKAVAEANSDK